MTHHHAEAFRRMIYRCSACGAEERIWNSRDGITPFGVDCRSCGGDAHHVEWHRDQYMPGYRPQAGERYFVNLTLERAMERRREYVNYWWEKSSDTFPAMKDSGMFASKEDAVERLARGDMESFAPSTPDLVAAPPPDTERRG